MGVGVEEFTSVLGIGRRLREKVLKRERKQEVWPAVTGPGFESEIYAMTPDSSLPPGL